MTTIRAIKNPRSRERSLGIAVYVLPTYTFLPSRGVHRALQLQSLKEWPNSCKLIWTHVDQHNRSGNCNRIRARRACRIDQTRPERTSLEIFVRYRGLGS